MQDLKHARGGTESDNSRTQSAPGDKGTTDATIPVDPDTWQTVPGKRRWSGQQPRSLGASPTLAGSEQTRPPKRSCNSFAVLADHPTSSDPTMHNIADADTNTATAATHSLGSAGGDSPMRQSSMTLRPKRMTRAKVVAHTTRPTKRKTSSHIAYQRASSRQRAARQQAVRPTDSQSADSQPADSQSASQQQPADSKQRTHGEQAEAMATPRTDPPGKAVKRKCPPTLDSARPSTRRRVDQDGHRTVRQKRKRQDRNCVTPDRPRTRQRIADRESSDSMQTMRCVPRKLTPCGADAGVPFDPG